MSNKIKNLKPKTGKNSRFKQGYFDISESQKYFGDPSCIYRSSYEYKFMVHCERNQSIIRWSSEPFGIKYPDETGKLHTYYIDFVVKYKNGDTYLIEVKPYSQTIPQRNKTYKKNAAKWAAARAYCEANGYKFSIVTEKTLQRM